MGTDGDDAVPRDGEGPARPVTLGAFRIGATTITNAEFADFVRATCHVTDGMPRANVFRGDFANRPARGWRPAPVAADAGEANGFGLFNVCGNVWEWRADARDGDRRALRGGLFLCHDSYCDRYRVSARSANTPASSTSNIGFRVVVV